MAAVRTPALIGRLRAFALSVGDSSATDSQLVVAFVASRNEQAFEVLLRRHGPMVLAVCRRILLNHHDAEDAFQATFLVLAKKAGTIQPPQMVGKWLHGVAYRTALEARTVRAKRHSRHSMSSEVPEAVARPEPSNELEQLLNEELSRLPDYYSAAIVLCDLEGKTQKEVARQLGCPTSTVANRLVRGRSLLAKRLARRGVVVSGVTFAAILSANAVSACVRESLIIHTIKAVTTVTAGGAATAAFSAKVAALSEGVMRAMFIKKIGLAGLLAATAALVLGAVLFTQGVAASKSLGAQEPGSKPDAEKRSTTDNGDRKADQPAQDGKEAENLFRQMEEKLSKARTLECVFEGKVQPKGSLKGSLAFAEGNKVRVEYSLEIEGDRQVKGTVVSDGAKVVKVLNGKEPEQVFEQGTEDVPLKPQSLRAMILRSFGLAGGCAILELSSFEVKVSGFKFGKKDKLDGRDAQIIEYEMTVEGVSVDGTSISAAIWLDAKTTLPIKRVATIDKGSGEKYTVTEIYTNLTLNKNIDAKKFELPK